MRKIVAGKLHGIYVTEANLNYHGSITLDPAHAPMLPSGYQSPLFATGSKHAYS
jgi:hypothetical protein